MAQVERTAAAWSAGIAKAGMTDNNDDGNDDLKMEFWTNRGAADNAITNIAKNNIVELDLLKLSILPSVLLAGISS